MVPFTGVIADRFERRALLMWTSLGELVSSSALLACVALHRADLTIFIAAAIARGTTFSFQLPSLQGLLRDVVGTERLVPAMAVNSVQLNLCRLTAPSLAGLIIAWFGNTVCFAVRPVSCVVFVFALMSLGRVVAVKETPVQGGLLAELKEGLFL